MGNKGMLVAICLVLAMILPLACAPAAGPSPSAATPLPAPTAAPAAPAPVVPQAAMPAKPAWQIEWDRTVEAARKERALMGISTGGPVIRQALYDAFKSAFGIGIEFLAGAGAELGVRVVNERRAKIYSVDVGTIGFSVPAEILKPAGALDSPERALFLPELTDPQEIQKAWRTGKLEWVDKDRTILTFTPTIPTPVVINSNMVKAGEIRTYRDLLEPKWKGKIVMYDPTLGTGPGSTWVQPVGSQIMGWDYMRKLAAQEPVITRDARLLMEWVAHGKSAIGIAPRVELVKEFLDVGAPVQRILPEEGGYLATSGGAVILIKDAPHPNTAKLFINWLLSREGQSVWVKSYGNPSGRMDVSTEGVDPLNIPDPKKNYVRTDTEEMLQMRPEAVRMAREIFGPLTKK